MAWIRWGVYACFFLSGATSMVFEVLWSRQFVTVFGNSSYAISIVLCAYLAGLGLGGLIGGRLADRMTQWTKAFGVAQAGIAAWALILPALLARLRTLAPTLSALSPDSLLVSTLARFALSFAILFVPCFLMGTTLPLLVRAVTRSEQTIGTRIGALYCWNTLGAALGTLAAGFWMLETLGLRLTNRVAAGDTLLVALAALALSRSMGIAARSEPANGIAPRPAPRLAVPEPATEIPAPGFLLLSVAFLNGVASLVCEGLWVRYLAFLGAQAYVFPTILGVYLLGLGVGGLIYGLLADRIRLSARALGVIELLLAFSVLAAFVAGALVFAGGPPRPLELTGMAFLTLFAPTVLMGMAFPLLCRVSGREVQSLGRRVGLLFAVNAAGTVVGSVLPIFVLVPGLGIQRSLVLVSLAYGGMGLALLACGRRRSRRLTAGAAAAYAAAVLLFLTGAPSDLCQRVFLATDFNLARHTDLLFYREGRTGTVIVARDRADDRKTVYVNGVSEVPVSYPNQLCFKRLGDLGPLLHPNPDDVLMICFGGGIAAGATTQLPEVKSLVIVDLESSVVEAARLLANENDGLLQNPKARVVIDDGRNYLLTARRRWPVIISDSTHPKSGDSWVLYTQEFYRLVRDHLAADGVFVQWVPMHLLRTAEFKIIARTFQSVFPHASLWVDQGIDANGQFVAYTLLVATPGLLRIDVARLRERLSVAAVRQDLEPYGLHTPAGFLDGFVCGEDALRHWVGEGPVNTDDLPYTQYETIYSEGPDLVATQFVEPMEDLWPCLTGTGAGEPAEQLRAELSLRARASRLALLGRIEEACALLPEDGRYRQMRRLYDGGPQYVRTLLQDSWNNAPALNFLAGLRGFGPGDTAAATKPIYERVLQLDPENAVALRVLGAIYLGAGDFKLAENYLRRAVNREPEFAASRYNLGLLLAATGRGAEAREEWRKGASASHESAAAADQWAVCLTREGRVLDAIPWFQHALELQPTFIDARLHLAAALHQTGHAAEALPQVRYVLKLDPENHAALRLLAKMEQ
jgi:spermidine synthase